MKVRTEMEKINKATVIFGGDESGLDEGSSNGAGDKWRD